MSGLFRKKPAKDRASSRRKRRDFEEEDFEMPADEEAFDEIQTGGAPEEPSDVGYMDSDDMEGTDLAGVKELSELLGRFEEVEDKIGRIDSALTSEKGENVKVRDHLAQMEQDIRKLLSVYEVVSAKFNPFIEMSDKDSAAPAQAPPEKPKLGEELPFGPIEVDGDLPEFKPFEEGEAEAPSFARPAPSRPGRDTPPWEPGKTTGPLETVYAEPRLEPPSSLDKTSKDERYEKEVRAASKSKHNKKPLLAYIPHDYLTLVLVMRWIEFLFERVTRDKISLVLDYYVDVGWISEDVKSEIMSYARGEMQDVTKYMGHEEVQEEVFSEVPAPTAAPYKKVEDWRLSADDHLKSLLFIQKVAGLEVDKDRLNSLEQNILKFKESLEGFHGV